MDQHILVDLPGRNARNEIFAVLLRHTPLDLEANSEELEASSEDGGVPVSRASLCRWLADKTAGASGADLRQLCQSAALRCLRDTPASANVAMCHFREALLECGFIQVESGFGSSNYPET